MQYQFKASLISYVGATGHKYFFRMIRDKSFYWSKEDDLGAQPIKRLVSVHELVPHSLVSANEV